MENQYLENTIPTEKEKTDSQAARRDNDDFFIYQLSPPPPVFDDLQEYIKLYLAEKEERYFLWFMHYYEKTINSMTLNMLKHYKMSVSNHFTGLKSACVLGIWEALKEYGNRSDLPFTAFLRRFVHAQALEYIRENRPALTVPNERQYKTLRKVMGVFSSFGGRFDDSTIRKTAYALGMSENTARKHIILALRAQEAYSLDAASSDDEDSLSLSDRLYSDSSLEPENLIVSIWQNEAVWKAFLSLSFRERDIVATYLDFNPDTGEPIGRDEFGFDKNGEKKPTFEQIANNYGLRSARSAERIFHQAIEKLKT